MGSNLQGPWGPPAATLQEALRRLADFGVVLVDCSTIVSTTPYGRTDQPVFANAVAAVETHLPPSALLKRLHMIEALAGRRRAERWGPRALDLDLLCYETVVTRGISRQEWRSGRRHPLVLPHPELHLRPFVLEPIREIAPFWHHPVLGLTAAQLSQRLPGSREGRVLGRA
ncbi:2-amino-4-hydroxy-6-hydroxymethyldihydropteridine diphosphokinase [Rhodoligotrophos defluvii]|uniref:2-amino-4-hydroxy-6- hydroxymethyldihydropteridine diphosphokinase n=1 Tax=Rhodoligotrophos defluvii TaxID=2561934 RepID=UPI001EEFBEC3|nr:2-amino-4-hydroxy-6-hydroxymethyldihydropteridine diphosphokinase [Rhodoligotrophos defluvii]